MNRGVKEVKIIKAKKMAKVKTAYNMSSIIWAVIVLAVLLVGIMLGAQLVQQKTETAPDAASNTGSGAPSGAHFNLNIIGVPKGKTADMSGNQGHRIFVPLTGSCQIQLAPGSFQVLDANCTDGKSQFQLPNPDSDNDGITTYSVWARALGKPGGRSETTTCATDPLTKETYCSIYTMIQVREKGKSTFENVSKQLLYVYADINADGIVERMPLFDSRLADYYWQYDNQGMKLVQLSFYEIPTNVN